MEGIVALKELLFFCQFVELLGELGSGLVADGLVAHNAAMMDDDGTRTHRLHLLHDVG